MKNRELYKFYSERRWAEALLDGEVFFSSLAYFRDFEDGNTRGDRNEGSAIFRPAGGLVVNNEPQGTTFTLPDHAFVSRAKQEEIFVFCASRSLTEELREKFKATVYVEVLDIPKFCARIQAALPAEATFPGRPGHTRIGQRVSYYGVAEGGTPRWALPDVIATSKLESYAWQDEYRLVFSLTGALAFENVDLRVEPPAADGPARQAEHRTHLVRAGSLCDICRLREFQPGK